MTDFDELAHAALWLLRELEEQDKITPQVAPAYVALRKAVDACASYNYDAELVIGRGITGVVYNDSSCRFADSTEIRTSTVMGGYVRTRNTLYKILPEEPRRGK